MRWRSSIAPAPSAMRSSAERASGAFAQVQPEASFSRSYAVRATFSLEGRGHRLPPRGDARRDIEWPTRSESSTVSITLRSSLVEETRITVTAPGRSCASWNDAGLSAGSGSTRLSHAGDADNDASVVYRLKAASVNNAFNLGALHAFRCPDAYDARFRLISRLDAARTYALADCRRRRALPVRSYALSTAPCAGRSR